MTDKPVAFTSNTVIETIHWVCSRFRSEQIQFQIAGVTAMAAHGAKRMVGGVDLFICANHLPKLIRIAKDHIIDYPWRRRDDHWDMVVMVLEVNGILVTVGIADGARIRTEGLDEWRNAAIDVSVSEFLTVEDIEFPVMPRAQLFDLPRLADPGESS